VRGDVDCLQAAIGFVALVIGLFDLWLLDRDFFCLTERGAALIGGYLENFSLQPCLRRRNLQFAQAPGGLFAFAPPHPSIQGFGDGFRQVHETQTHARLKG